MEEQKKNGKPTIPDNLSHKPIFKVNGYAPIDGKYKNATDVVGMSVGKAQWSDEFVPSVKVWRYKEKDNGKGRWSRQSEETTVTRALDMATLAIKVYNHVVKEAPLETFDGPNVHGTIEITKACQPRLLKQLNDYFEEHRNDLESHIKMLKEALDNCKL